MKHQYLGDINDFRKYALLRLLAVEGSLRIGISWMLTPGDGRPDGGKTAYLDQPRRWRAYDPDLFDHLAAFVKSGHARDLGVVEASNLIPGARYHSDILEDGVVAREAYMKTMRDRFHSLDFVFFDPDNGLEVDSCRMGQKRSSKYLALKEAESTFSDGASLLIFQHYPRVERVGYARDQVQRLRASIGEQKIVALETSHVLFLLVLHDCHLSAARRALGTLDRNWNGQFKDVTPNRELPPPSS